MGRGVGPVSGGKGIVYINVAECGQLGREVRIVGLFTAVKSDIKFPSAPTRGTNESWFDPVVGGRGTLLFGENWRARMAAVVGGFGIGEASELTWGTEAFVGYRLSELTTLWFGYRYLSMDRDFGVGPARGEIDVNFQGQGAERRQCFIRSVDARRNCLANSIRDLQVDRDVISRVDIHVSLNPYCTR